MVNVTLAKPNMVDEQKRVSEKVLPLWDAVWPKFQDDILYSCNGTCMDKNCDEISNLQIGNFELNGSGRERKTIIHITGHDTNLFLQ